jgi:hypothetical protein
MHPTTPATHVRRAALAALTAASLLSAVAPADAKPVRHVGKTSAGDPISVTVRGGAVANLSTSTPMSCVPTSGTPRAGTDLFEPAGRFPLGRTTTAQTDGPVETAMHYNEVTKHVRVTVRRAKARAITGILHQNYSFETLTYTSGGDLALLPWVCRGDVKFRVRAR